MSLQTERLILRPWVDEDRGPFAVLNSDPMVMEHCPGPMTRTESDAFVDRIVSDLEREGFGLWAVEVLEGVPFIGFVGLARPRFEGHFTPAVELGSRLAKEHWGREYATEATHRCLRFAFDDLGLDEIVSFATPQNQGLGGVDPSWTHPGALTPHC